MRWAIFYDGLGLKWEYEPQGFVVDGTAYLPDFMVFGALGLIWVEIKPDWRSDAPGVARWRKFTGDRPQPSRSALFIGLPTPRIKPTLIGGDDTSSEPGKGGWEDDTHEWRPCPSGNHFDLAYPGQFRGKFAEDGCEHTCGLSEGEEKISKASVTALSYRFGKSGNKGTAA